MPHITVFGAERARLCMSFRIYWSGLVTANQDRRKLASMLQLPRIRPLGNSPPYPPIVNVGQVGAPFRSQH